jgi:hypothetical protein
MRFWLEIKWGYEMADTSGSATALRNRQPAAATCLLFKLRWAIAEQGFGE